MNIEHTARAICQKICLDIGEEWNEAEYEDNREIMERLIRATVLTTFTHVIMTCDDIESVKRMAQEVGKCAS